MDDRHPFSSQHRPHRQGDPRLRRQGLRAVSHAQHKGGSSHALHARRTSHGCLSPFFFLASEPTAKETHASGARGCPQVPTPSTRAAQQSWMSPHRQGDPRLRCQRLPAGSNAKHKGGAAVMDVTLFLRSVGAHRQGDPRLRRQRLPAGSNAKHKGGAAVMDVTPPPRRPTPPVPEAARRFQRQAQGRRSSHGCHPFSS